LAETLAESGSAAAGPPSTAAGPLVGAGGGERVGRWAAGSARGHPVGVLREQPAAG
jgi:hypothetical protein